VNTRKIVAFFKTPKGLLTIILLLLAVVAAPSQGAGKVAPGLLAAMAGAGIVDAFILRARNLKARNAEVRQKAWEFPSGAVLTALIVAMVLRAQEPWWVVTVTSIFAVVTKYVFRSRTANVFNPAALAIVVSYFVFHTGQSWWGALTEVPLAVQALLLVTGLFITDRVNKMPLVLTFLGAYFLLFTATAYLGDPKWVSEIYRSPDIEAVLFFAFIIVTDPPTSPAKYPDQIIFGLIVAVVSYTLFERAGVVFYLLAGVLVANVWEAWRRANRRLHSSFPSGIGAFLVEISPWLRSN
jgi:Na+-translocating ferredoxin:NAD+ oxidoreductase RnfD subunit